MTPFAPGITSPATSPRTFGASFIRTCCQITIGRCFLLWLRLNDALFGLHPWGWHLTSVLAHVAVTYLVYCLALTVDARHLGRRGSPD